MDQPQPQTSQVAPINWDYCIQQLNKIQTLQNRVNFSDNRIDASQDQIQEIKKNLKGEQQGQLDQENVIDDKKLPSTLTNNEKKRYEQIGKQFVQGAGKQFAKVKQAIANKEKMQTKSDNIRQQIDKAKQSNKKVKQGNGFWKKLLMVVGILGLVALMFKDKLLKIMPDMSNGLQGVGDKVFDFFKGLISGMVSYSQKIIGGSLTGLITFICNEILPSTIGTFFGQTLPMALVVATLSVMSMLSENADEQLTKYLNETSEETGDNVTERALQEAEAKLKNQQTIQTLTSDEILKANKEQLVRWKTNFANFLWAEAINGGNYDDTAFGKLDSAVDRDGITVDLASSGFNMTALLEKIYEIQGNSGITDKSAAIEQAIKLQMEYAQIDVNGIDFSSSHDALISLANAMRADTRYTTLSSQITSLSNSKSQQAAEQIDGGKSSNVSFLNVSQIKIDQVMMNVIAQQTQQVLNQLDSFLNDKGDTALFNGIDAFMGNLKEKTDAYFISVLRILAESVTRGLYIQIPQTQSTSGNSKFSISVGENSNVGIINITFSDLFTSQFNSLTSISQQENDLINCITESNGLLEKINADLDSGLFVFYVDDTKLNEKIESSLGQIKYGVWLNECEIKQHEERISQLENPNSKTEPVSKNPKTIPSEGEKK